ncbi:peptidoglycan DD-metalloendopeptidase family protein [Patescibacteria group bacterium]
MEDISRQIKKFTVKAVLFLFKGLILLKRIIAPIFKAIKILFSSLFKIFLKVGGKSIILSVYKGYTFIKKILATAFLPAKNKILYPLINKGTIHFIVIFLTVLILVSNIKAKIIHAENIEEIIGGNSILASLVSEELGDTEIIEEMADVESDIVKHLQTDYLDEKSFGVKDTNQQIGTSHEDTADGVEEEFQKAMIISGSDALVKPDITSTLETPEKRDEIIQYLVQTGDVIGSIASKFNVSMNTILWENNLSYYSIIRPGDTLSILPVSGISHSVKSGETLGFIANKYSAEIDKVLAYNNLKETDVINKGQKLIIPDGIKRVVSVPSVASAGSSNIQKVFAGAPSKYAADSGFIWPTTTKRITQYYNWKHHGLDIGGKTGNSIYAIEKGQIILSGWTKGYGYNIIVDHGGGQKSRYAHFSKLYVKKGALVSKGQQIGEMGSTGWSTGPHLHLEIIINGAKVNPLKYIK